MMSPRSLLLVSSLMMLPACDAPDGAAGQAADEPSQRDAILAEVPLADGQLVRFVDEGVGDDGVAGIGVMIVGSAELIDELSRDQPTPLELFLALAPEEDAPAALWDSHEHLALAADASSTPRALELDLIDPLNPSRGQTTQSFNCSTFFDHFCEDMASGSTVCNETYGVGNTDNYAGTAGQRWLGACNASTSPAPTWKVEAQTSATVWSLIAGTSITLATGQNVLYTSSGATSQNYRSLIRTTGMQAYYVGTAR